MARKTQHIGACMHDVIASQCAAMGLGKERIAQFFDPDREPDPEPCPYCGRPLHHKPLVADDPSWGWRPLPEPCENPECVAKAEVERARKENRARIAKLHRDMRDAGIPKLYEHSTSGTFEPRNEFLRSALDAVKTWTLRFDDALESGRGLYICGPPCSGKTHLAVIAARGALCGDHYVRFVTAADLEARIRSAGGYDPLNEYRNCALLVLDGIGMQSDQRWILTRICGLIEERRACKRPTVYTSRCSYTILRRNLKLADAETADAVSRLIAETSQVVKVIGAHEREGGQA